MANYALRISLAFLFSLVVLGCAPSPQNQKYYIAELKPSSATSGLSTASTTAPNTSSTAVQTKRVYTDLREQMWLESAF